MKKTIYQKKYNFQKWGFAFICLLFLVSINMVKAQDIEDLKLKWTYESQGRLTGEGIAVGNNYYSFAGERVQKYNITTGFEKEISLKGTIDSYVEINNKIMVLTCPLFLTTNGLYYNYFYVLDQDLNIVETKEFDSSSDYYRWLFKYENQVYVSNRNGTYKVDENLNIGNVNEEINIEQEDLWKYFESKLVESYPNEIVYLEDVKVTKENKYVITAFAEIYDSTAGKYKNTVIIAYYDTDKTEIFKKEVYQIESTNRYSYYYDNNMSIIEKIDEYIIVSFLDENYVPRIYVYNEQGEKVKELNNTNLRSYIIPSYMYSTEKGIVIAFRFSKWIMNLSSVQNSVSLLVNNNTTTYRIQKLEEDEILGDDSELLFLLLYYEFPYAIKTKTDGFGEITSTVQKAESGEEVEFTIIPKEGYVLGEVKVTDANGNSIIFTDYKFTMPSADVTIEATFLPENPNTKDIAIIVILFLAVIGGIVFIKNRKKLNILK